MGSWKSDPSPKLEQTPLNLKVHMLAPEFEVVVGVLKHLRDEMKGIPQSWGTFWIKWFGPVGSR